MAIIDKVFKSMKEGHSYDPSTISAMCHISEDDAGRYLHMLSKGGVIECVSHNRFRKSRKYKTKQASLFS